LKEPMIMFDHIPAVNMMPSQEYSCLKDLGEDHGISSHALDNIIHIYIYIYIFDAFTWLESLPYKRDIVGC
jgi:hypothetical protein